MSLDGLSVLRRSASRRCCAELSRLLTLSEISMLEGPGSYQSRAYWGLLERAPSQASPSPITESQPASLRQPYQYQPCNSEYYSSGNSAGTAHSLKVTDQTQSEPGAVPSQLCQLQPTSVPKLL
ncbi:hypothetical protein DPEC_G00023640 [Dallia pectoralis]|uniref:Uncharacterized protein n=1 Tax=Dallia pectoralis TaxID=75939 RepID=A0ACC2HGW3_DALPE|nr:hypothetical protein DPEC_G00023640 [Dallia pectoralis]